MVQYKKNKSRNWDEDRALPEWLQQLVLYPQLRHRLLSLLQETNDAPEPKCPDCGHAPGERYTKAECMTKRREPAAEPAQEGKAVREELSVLTAAGRTLVTGLLSNEHILENSLRVTVCGHDPAGQRILLSVHFLHQQQPEVRYADAIDKFLVSAGFDVLNNVVKLVLPVTGNYTAEAEYIALLGEAKSEQPTR